MSHLSAEDEAELQSLLKHLLRSINDRISVAPSTERAEEILLHLEETDKNFHNYEFVKYLRQYVENSLGSVVEEETRRLTRGDGQHAVDSGHDSLTTAVTQRTQDSEEYQHMMQTLKSSMILVVESLINKFEEDQMRKEGSNREKKHGQTNSQFTDNCSDSDSSFNQSYAFIRQEQLQALAEKLDSSRPKEVQWEALQELCCAPPSDVLSCESWSGLRKNLCAALTNPDLSDSVLQFFAKSFSSSPLNVTREIYSSLAKSVETSFLTYKRSFPNGATSVDISRPEISHLLKQIRLMNDFQKEVTTFWIRYPEKYMEEVIESTFFLLSFHQEHVSAGTEKVLEPVHLLSLLDVKATWFKKWMHGNYSRTVVLRFLERKYKSVMVAALQHCIHYCETCQHFTDQTTDPESAEMQQTNLLQRSVYTGKELDYAVFVHSLCLLGKLLIYSNGRKLFPIRVKKSKDPVSLTDVLLLLINILYQHPKPHRDAPHTEGLSPSVLLMDVLWTLCERTESGADCFYTAPVIATLLEPVRALLQGQQAKLKSPAATLTLIADVLARIANTDRGLNLFLHERNVVIEDGQKTSAAHVIVRFTLRLLGKDLPTLSDSDISCSLCGAFIFVCRQMYNTCEGLQVLRPYSLHTAVAAAWKRTIYLSERVSTPVPGVPAETSTQELQSMLLWEETLLDSLLNFAVTPKGLLLLQQTGAINECMSYMFSRFTKKLQVSRCEKFGYGLMVTQVAATTPGVVALHRSGFVRALVLDLWSVLECGTEDVTVVRPKTTAMEPIDRSCLKSFLSLVNLLSSSQAVWELLGQQPLANKNEYSLREIPTSIPDLIDRLISVNSRAKIHSLFHHEQSHMFGLRLLSVLCCNLDSFLLLETQYNICSMLLQSQRDNVSDQGEFIVDSLSVERNHLLVCVFVIGGPSERNLPPRVLQEGGDPYPWPMFSSFPPPPCYTLNPPNILQSSQGNSESEISGFLASSKDQPNDESWMETCRREFCRVMKSRPDSLTGNVLADLLQTAVVHLSSSSSECFCSPAQYKAEEQALQSCILSPVEQMGVHTCVRYGRFLKLLKDDAVSELTRLMKHLKIFLSTQRVKTASQLITQQESFPGFDWLASTIFLLMAGDTERTLHLLLHLSSLLTSALIWPARIHASVHVPVEVAESGIPPVYWITAHYVEMLLKSELPLVHSAFRMSGFTPSQMCLHWITQCFWNFLDWTQICHYLSSCVLMGPDYQVYLCVAVLKHLQPEILQHTQAQDLQVFLKEEPIRGFRVSSYLDFMEELEHRYRDLVLMDMRTFCDPVL